MKEMLVSIGENYHHVYFHHTKTNQSFSYYFIWL